MQRHSFLNLLSDSPGMGEELLAWLAIVSGIIVFNIVLKVVSSVLTSRQPSAVVQPTTVAPENHA